MSNYALSYIFKAIDEFCPIVEKMHKSMEKFQAQIGHSNAKLYAFQQTMRTVGMNILKYVAIPMGTIGIYAIKNAEQFKMMEMRLRAFSGSAEKAAMLMQNVRNMSMSTGIKAETLAAASTSLLRYGYTAEQVQNKLKQMSMFSIVSGTDMGAMTSGLGRMKQLGYVTQGFMTRMADKGIPLIAAFREYYHLSDKAWESLKGKAFDFKLIEPVLAKMTEDGSSFAKAYNEMLKSPENSISRIHKAVRDIAASFGAVLMKIFPIEEVLFKIENKMQEFAERAPAFFERHKDLIKFLVIAGAITVAVGAILAAWSMMGYIIGTVIVGGVIYLYKKFELVRIIINSIWAILKFVGQAFAYMIKDVVSNLTMLFNLLVKLMHIMTAPWRWAKELAGAAYSGAMNSDASKTNLGVGGSSILNQFSRNALSVNVSAPKSVDITQGGKKVGEIPFTADRGATNLGGWSSHVFGVSY